VICKFEGGPFNGYEIHMIGRDDPPDYLMLKPTPAGDGGFIVVGIEFNDHWPDQSRYDWQEDLKAEVAPGRWEDLAIYAFTGNPT